MNYKALAKTIPFTISLIFLAVLFFWQPLAFLWVVFVTAILLPIACGIFTASRRVYQYFDEK